MRGTWGRGTVAPGSHAASRPARLAGSRQDAARPDNHEIHSNSTPTLPRGYSHGAGAGSRLSTCHAGTLAKSLSLLLEGIPCPLHHTWANPCPRGKAAAPPAAS